MHQLLLHQQMDIANIILFQLDKTSKVVKHYSQREFEKRGMNITVDQWVLLKIIHEKMPISQTELAEFSVRDPASITRTLDILTKKNLTNRERIEGNRRQYNVVLTKSGVEFVEKHFPFVKAQRAKSVNGLTPTDMKELTRMLGVIQGNMR